MIKIFQSTLLMRGATPIASSLNSVSLFQSTLLMRGATRNVSSCFAYSSYFNPRSSCEERRFVLPRQETSTIFQSTLLMRGATEDKAQVSAERGDFNPRSSCEERLAIAYAVMAKFDISIHAPHARSDLRQSQAPQDEGISIHAPHARSDRT